MVDFEAIKKELGRLETTRQKGDFERLKLTKGAKTLIRVLPEFDEKGLMWFRILYHWNIEKYPLACSSTWDNSCVLCDYIAAESKDDEKRKRLWRHNAQPTYLMNVLNMSEGQDNTKVYVADFFAKIAQPIFAFAADPALNLVDPIKGRNLVIDTTSKDPLVYPDPNTQSAVPVSNDILDKLYKLDQLVKAPTEDVIAIALQKLATIANTTLPGAPAATTKAAPSTVNPAVPGANDGAIKEQLTKFLSGYDKKK